MKKIRIIILLGVVLFALYILYSLVPKGAHESIPEISYLPSTPESATYLHKETEITFSDEQAQADITQEAVAGEVVYGDMNGDNREDALVPFIETESGTYYIALALKEETGYLGINTVPLHQDTPPEMRIENEIMYLETEEDGLTSTRYFTLVGTQLMERDITNPLMYGYYRFDQNGGAYFTTCTEEEIFTIATSSPSYVVLKTLFGEKRHTSTQESVFAVVAGMREASEEGQQESRTISVTAILQVPKNGICPTSG